MNQFVDEVKLETAIGKLKMYHKEESIVFDTTSKLLRELADYYKTNSTSLLETISDEFISKFKTIQKNQNYGISVMEKTLTGYRETKKKVEHKLGDMM